MKSLIINADDYGLSPGVSEGIRQAHLGGVVTSTSAMLNCPHVEEELVRLIRLCPRIGIGIHLVFTVGKPVLPVKSLPGLMSLAPDGKQFFKGIASKIDQVDPAEVKAEWTAQIEKFIQIIGRAPDHLDAHHHAMCFNGQLFEIYLELAKTYQCPVRRPLEGTPASRLEEKIISSMVVMPDGLDTRFYGDDASEAMLEQMVSEVGEGTTEWMCHPGRVDEELMNVSDYNTRRVDELNLLTGSVIRSQMKEAHIKLITFGDL